MNWFLFSRLNPSKPTCNSVLMCEWHGCLSIKWFTSVWSDITVIDNDLGITCMAINIRDWVTNHSVGCELIVSCEERTSSNLEHRSAELPVESWN